MKRVYIMSASCFLCSVVLSQGNVMIGRTQMNLGVGLSEFGTPVYIGMDYGANRSLSIGGELSFRSYNEYWGQYNYRRSITGIAANANYHFNTVLLIPSVYDFYAGLNLGFYNWSSPDSRYYGNHSSGLGLGAQIGGRYYFTRKFGVNLEFGGGNAFSGGKFGLTFKL